MKRSVLTVSFLQALGVVLYISFVSGFMMNAERLFGKMDGFWGPLLFLVLFCVSALVCALSVFGYPFLVFWEQKKTKKALKIVIYTAGWLAVFMVLLMIRLLVF